MSHPHAPAGAESTPERPARSGDARVSDAARQVPASGIREVLDAALTRDLDVLRLEIGEPDFRTADHIIEAAHRAELAGVRYTQSAGVGELREILARQVAAKSGAECGPEDVIVTQGGVQGCALAFAALLGQGDEVLIPDPAWPNFEMLALLHGASPVRYPLRPENRFLPDPAEVARAIGPRTRILVLNSPSNPTGAVFPPGLVRDLVETAARHQVTVLSDEVYEQLIFEGEACNARTYAHEHVVSVYSFSKSYSMTGWRVGYVAAPAWLAPTLVRLQEAQLSCVSAVSQAAALAAAIGPQQLVTIMRESYRRRRDLAVGLCADAGVPVVSPDGAFYLMVPLGDGVDSSKAAMSLLDHGLAVAPGTAFGDVARSFVRVTLAVSEPDLTEGLRRLIAWRGQESR